MSTELKAHVRGKIEDWGKSYANDLRAMSEEQLAASPGGSARTPYDFTYECVYVNNRVAARLRGEDPGPWTNEGWMKAPDDFRNKDAALGGFEASVKSVLDGIDATPPEKLRDKIALPTGETSPLAMADLVASHLCYHDAQLNYHQAIHGDEEVHWGG